MTDYGTLYYDHYEKFLGRPIAREVFSNNETMPKIQVLNHEHVFEGCQVYTTLGFSHYEDIVGDNLEISMVVDSGFDSVAYILANTLYYCILNRVQMGRGVAIGGIGRIDRMFAQTYNKDAVYFTDTFAFPEDYGTVRTADDAKNARMLLAIFITSSEYEYFLNHGANALEEQLEAREADPFELARENMI